MKWIVIFSLLLSSCVSTNQFLSMGGANGTKENLPVDIGVIIEMAEYCEEIYDDGKEIRDNEFSYNVVQDRGVTIVSIRGTCLLYTSPSPRDLSTSRMPSSA